MSLKIKEIIDINKVITKNKLDKIKPRSNEMKIGYNNHIKPLLDGFQENYSYTPPVYLKKLLERCNSKNMIPNLKLKTFGNWGRKINPYIWASFFLDNENEYPFSNSIQLYLLVSDSGIKFGFDYGDKVRNDDSIVQDVKKDEMPQSALLNIASKYSLEVLEIGAGSPNKIPGHRIEDNIIKEKKNFELWNEKIHIIRSYNDNNIPLNIEDEIVNVLDDFLKMFLSIKTINNSNEKDLEGMLLYPSTHSKIRSKRIVNGKKITINKINLNQDWKLVENELMEVIN